jgi:hypothetical protein
VNTSPAGILDVLAFFVNIDAQKDPWAAILAAAAVGLLLWFAVAQARRRDERRAKRRDEGGRPRFP